MGKYIILERLGTILTPIKHLLDKLEANKVDKSELNEILEPKVDRDELNNALRPKVDREELNEILEPKVNRDELYDALEIKVDKQELDVAISNVVSSIPDVNDKMNIDDPVGLGSFSMNRRSGSSIGLYSTTLGYNNVASGRSSLAEGNASIAKGKGAHAEGDSSTAASDYSHAEGRSITFGFYSHAEGYETQATMRSQHVHGEFNELDPLTATGKSNNQNRGKYIHIIGNGKSADQLSNAHTLDWDGLAWFARGIKVGGTGQDDPSAQKVALKGDHLSDFINDVGYITTEEVSLAYPTRDEISLAYPTRDEISLAYPTRNEISSTYATIDNVRQEIEELVGAAPETLNTLEELADAFQEHEDMAISLRDAVINKMDKSNPKGAGSFSLNRKADTTIGTNSSALGQDNTASGFSSFASGINTIASGYASHTEGSETISLGSHSHAEGNYSIALGFSSHAEGYGSYNPLKVYIPAGSSTCTIVSRASGGPPGVNVGDIVYYNNIYAFVNEMPDSSTLILSRVLSPNSDINDTLVFTKTIAFGPGSHTEGYNSIALGSYSHVEGKNNISDATGNLAHILGNGSYPTNRSNAHTIDWSGNAWFSGDVYTGSTSGKNKDEGSKKLATENYVMAPKSELILIDKITGENYIVCIENGNLVSYKAE